MKICRSLSAGLVALSVGFAGAAQADVMTETWNGQVVSGPDTGDSVELTFTYDTANLGPEYPDGGVVEYFEGDPANLYSSATYSLNGGPATQVFGSSDTDFYSLLYLGDSTQQFKDYSQNYILSHSTGDFVDASFEDFVGGITTLDPTHTFTATGFAPSSAIAYLDLNGSTNNYDTITPTSVSLTDASVPAPASFALLGFGLIGIGGIRRKATTA
jgi:hypothetical protein